jgi:hypothetical protein
MMKLRSISVCNKALLWVKKILIGLAWLPSGWAYALPGPAMAVLLPRHEIPRLEPNWFISIDWFPYMNINSVKSLKLLHDVFIFVFSIDCCCLCKWMLWVVNRRLEKLAIQKDTWRHWDNTDRHGHSITLETIPCKTHSSTSLRSISKPTSPNQTPLVYSVDSDYFENCSPRQFVIFYLKEQIMKKKGFKGWLTERQERITTKQS